MGGRQHLVCALAALVALPAAAPAAEAETVNFELAGKIYTKWLYRNNDTEGTLWLGNPFWPDNITGENGVATEFELQILGNVGDHVKAGVRIKSRYGALWQDWWENGDISYDEENTSGESLGMNRAQYMKLRGYWITVNLPVDFIDVLLIGSSDLAMFNEWSIGKVRYIDRDNGKGIFLKGRVDDQYLRYHFGIIALPKLWVGPNWSTGVGDPLLRAPFYSRDWAYGLKLNSDIADGVGLELVTTLTRDSEIDFADPDAIGSENASCTDELGNPIPNCERNGAVDTVERYSNLVTTLEAQVDSWDGGSFNLIGGLSWQSINPDAVGNGVELNNGVFPLVYEDDMLGYFVRARAEFFDLADGLGLKVEYFNIGEHFQTIFGARREADVLWTDGFVEGGQIPTLNSANEFVDWDEGWFETIIGWHGGTLLLEYVDDLELSLEGTFLTYNTNQQERNVETKYPDFLHIDGFTDTDLYDYANVFDRGRDPRSVYKRNQDRMSAIAVLGGLWHTGAGEGLDIGFKFKFIWDGDKRSDTTSEDDYTGLMTNNRIWFRYPLADGLDLKWGTKVEYWIEDNRKGSLEQGYGNDTTLKALPFIDLSYNFDGFAARYRIEYLYKDAQRERDDNLLFHVIRSKATVEVAW